MSDNVTSQMSFLEHLEELRWRLIKSIIAILFGGSFCFLFIDEILQSLIAPIRNLSNPPDLQVLKVQGMFMIKWGVALLGGIVVAIPVLTYQIAKFIGPGLYKDEKKVMVPLVFFSYMAFLAGIVFAYYVLIPYSLEFFTSMGMMEVKNNFSINYYFSFISMLLLGSGVIFELPIVVFILSEIGLLTPAFMRHYRRHAIVVILVLSAFITPPDPISLVFISIPLAFLYEISIGVSWMVNRSK
jgi:sec-independent protein translocase protein TatC